VRLPDSLDALRERNYARYLGSVVVSHLGNGMANVALAFAVLEFGTPTDLGIVLLAREIPMIVFLLLGGVFADRMHRRTILIGTDLVKGSAQVATALLLFETLVIAGILNVVVCVSVVLVPSVRAIRSEGGPPHG
jgi:MFS family permease